MIGKPGDYNGDAVNHKTHSFDDANYSATDIIEELGFHTINYMREIIADTGLTILEEDKYVFNIDKFFIRMKVNTEAALRFKLVFSSCTDISNIVQFQTTITSGHTIRLDAGESFIHFTNDLRSNNYAKLDDLISRNVINIRSRLDKNEELTSPGYTLVNQVLKSNSYYAYSPGYLEVISKTETLDGVYNATEILKIIEDFTVDFVRFVIDEKGYNYVSEYTSINLEFYGDFEVYIYGGKDLNFNVYFEECKAIQNIFGFPEIWRSVSDVQGTYLHIVFDKDFFKCLS